jgi:rubrerythrin
VKRAASARYRRRRAVEEGPMSRLPRHLEHLRTGFTAEAVSAATFRAFAAQAAGEGKPNLAQRWRALAEEKDRLAIALLRAAGKIEDESRNLRSAIAEEQYENEVLYPRLEADLEHLGQSGAVATLAEIQAAQQRHLAALDQLRRELVATTADVRPPDLARAG